MKKAKKVKILGEDWKYFVNRGSFKDDGEIHCEVILYAPDGGRYSWENANAILITAPFVRKAFADNKFVKVK